VSFKAGTVPRLDPIFRLVVNNDKAEARSSLIFSISNDLFRWLEKARKVVVFLSEICQIIFLRF